MGGTPGENKLADEMMSEWTRQGLDHVSRVTYDVLLSYPDKDNPNVIYLLDDKDTAQFTTQLAEEILSEDQDHPDVVPPFNAYSPAGNVQVLLFECYNCSFHNHFRLACN